MSIFINTELKSDLESRDIEPDSKKIETKLMAKWEKSYSDSEGDIKSKYLLKNT